MRRSVIRASRLPSRPSRGLSTSSPLSNRHKIAAERANWTGLRSPASKAAARAASARPAVPTSSNSKTSSDQQVQSRQDEPRQEEPSKVALVSSALAENESSDLVAPVKMPDDPQGILHPAHPAMAILNHSSLVIQRQIEMMNAFLGFEQANRYVIMDGRGQTIGYLAEQDHGIGSAVARQAFRTHRSFTSHIFDREEREVLRIHRPFAWINSRIRIYDPITGSDIDQNISSSDLQGVSANSGANAQAAASISSLPLGEMRIIGEAQQQWAPLRRKYNLFTHRPIEAANDDPNVQKLTSGDLPNTESKALQVAQPSDQAIEAGMVQFSHINEPFLSWDFTLRDAEDGTIGSVNRNFGGFAREIFTDTGVYALRMDSASLTEEPRHTISQTADQDAQANSSRALGDICSSISLRNCFSKA